MAMAAAIGDPTGITAGNARIIRPRWFMHPLCLAMRQFRPRWFMAYHPFTDCLLFGNIPIAMGGVDYQHRMMREKYLLEGYQRRKRSPPLPLSWERGHLGRYFSGRDVRAPRGE